jgi:uncharacterized protein (DUF427 family)
LSFLDEATGGSWCEWEGAATYWTIAAGGVTADRAAWSYPTPVTRIASNHPGGFYAGWITPDVVGPFTGEPGTMGW